MMQVGRLLAQRTGKEFVDTDALVEQAVGMPVPDYFAAKGESAFRERGKEANGRLPDAQHIEIGAVDDQQLHIVHSLSIRSAVSSGEPSPFTRRSAAAQ